MGIKRECIPVEGFFVISQMRNDRMKKKTNIFSKKCLPYEDNDVIINSNVRSEAKYENYGKYDII